MQLSFLLVYSYCAVVDQPRFPCYPRTSIRVYHRVLKSRKITGTGIFKFMYLLLGGMGNGAGGVLNLLPLFGSFYFYFFALERILCISLFYP